MRSYTKTVWKGERVGDIDWDYDFSRHFQNYCVSDETKEKMCKQKVELLREVEGLFKNGKGVIVETHGGYGHKLLDIGMYDGWPFWKPTPALLVYGPLGAEWHFFDSLQGYRIVEEEMK